MTRKATTVSLSTDVEHTLREWVEDAARRELMAQRAMIVLLAAEHHGTRQIARALGIRPATVSKWRTRFATYGIAGLQTAERKGKPPRYDEVVEARILAQVEQVPPSPHPVWTGPLLADAVGNVSVDYVWRVLRAHHVNLRRRDRQIYETGSMVVRSLVNITGLYLGPGPNVFLVGVAPRDPSAALDRLRTYVQLANPDAAVNLKCVTESEARPTLLQALRAAVPPAGFQHCTGHASRSVSEFLADAATRSGALQVCAYLTGTRIPMPRGIHPHFISDFEIWRDLLASALAISLEEAAANPSVVPGIVSAVADFLSHPSVPAATFEWHA